MAHRPYHRAASRSYRDWDDIVFGALRPGDTIAVEGAEHVVLHVDEHRLEADCAVCGHVHLIQRVVEYPTEAYELTWHPKTWLPWLWARVH